MSTWFGNGSGIDISLRPSDELATNTTQYSVVGIPPTTTAADRTVYLADAGAALNDTTCARHAIGINMTYLSAGAEACQVRIMGLAKAKCAASIASGSWIRAYEGISTTTFPGHIVALVDAVSVTVFGQTIASHKAVIGRALADGSTNSVIEVVLIPQLYDKNLISE